MFTIKFYGPNGYRAVIKEAESLTILRGDDGTAEITLHQKDGLQDTRIDLGEERPQPADVWMPPRFEKAIIENSAGKTTEIIHYRQAGLAPAPLHRPQHSEFSNV